MTNQNLFSVGRLFVQARIQYLDWDSGVLQRPCARVDIQKVSDARKTHTLSLLEVLKQEKYHYVIARFPKKQDDLRAAFLASGFDQVDEIVLLQKSLDRADGIVSFPKIRRASGDDERSIAQLSKESFKKSRFHQDPLIDDQLADQLYFEWGLNCAKRAIVDECWVWDENPGIAGFIADKIQGKMGIINLIAVERSKSGMGIGKSLVQHSVDWMSQMGLSHCQVQTQADNEAALRLYGKMGFVEIDRLITLRWAPSK